MLLQQLVLTIQVSTHQIGKICPQFFVLQLVYNHLQIGALLNQEKLVHFEQWKMGLAGNLVFYGYGRVFAHFGYLIFHSALYVAYEFWLFALEAGMVVVIEVPAALLGEAVHVELPDVRVHVLVLEVHREYGRRKFIYVKNYESVLLLVPAYCRTVGTVLNPKEYTSSISQVFIRKGGAFRWAYDIRLNPCFIYYAYGIKEKQEQGRNRYRNLKLRTQLGDYIVQRQSYLQ